MDVTPLIAQGQQIIQSYAGGTFKVSGEKYSNAIIVAPHDTILWEGVNDFESLTLDHFSGLVAQANDIDVVLLGTGAQMKFFNLALKSQLSTKGLPIDVMDTGAACRTYNVLMAEGRRVVAVLLPA
mgnify:CR=1 FL=1